MKEIKTPEAGDGVNGYSIKKQSKSISRILITLIVIIVLATAGLIIYQKARYNEYYFDYNDFPVHKVRQGNIDVYQIAVVSRDKQVMLTSRSNPKELDDIQIENKEEVLKNAFSKEEIFITMPSNATGVSIIAATEIAKISGNPNILQKPIPTHGALIESVEGKNATIMTCNNASNKTAVIELRYGNENKIYLENECVILEGTSEYDFIKLANRLTLTFIGIMD